MSLQSDARPAEVPKFETRLRPIYEIKQKEKITVVKPQGELERFSERQQLPLARFEYERNGSDPGLVLIFNQESFNDKTYRLGSRKDVNEIVSCFSRLGFNINETNIFTDYEREDIFKTINAISNQNLSGVNSLIVFFLTHGDSFNMLHAHDFSLRADEIWKIFGECEQLKNKPKMFIFQACKGEDYSTIADRVQKKIELVPEGTFRSDYIGPDMLIVYSTTEGNVSFRDPKNGTWFIQELCKNFMSYGRRDDVASLLMRTTKCLCRNYYHHEQDVIKKQMPIFVSTLKKKFYLNRSKDRNVWIQLIKNQEEIVEKINELEEKVNELVQDKEKRWK